MILLVGLGNPGKEYAQTRHNVGFKFLEHLDKVWSQDKQREGLVIGKAKYRLNFKRLYEEKNSSFKAREYELDFEKENSDFSSHVHVGLLEPLNFMNKSGEVVKKIIEGFRNDFHPDHEMLIIHDEMDLPLGEAKLSFGRGSARHKGVESIFASLGTREFSRLRVGISRAEGIREAKDYVLSEFNKEELSRLEGVLDRARQKVEEWVINTAKYSHGKINGKTKKKAMDYCP